jgi:hypothetical protein
MTMRRFLIAAWLVVAAVQVAVSVPEIMRWRTDPDLARMGFTWADSFIPHGIVAAVTAFGLLSNRRAGLWLAVITSSLFGLYYAAYLVFGGEGTFVLRVVVPLILLGIAAATIRLASRELRARNPASQASNA